MSDKERLEKIQQESITDAIEWGCQYGNRSQVKTDRIVDDVNWLIEQAEMFQSLAGHHDEALAENKRLREALEFYADANNYELNDGTEEWLPTMPIDKDSGERARKALEQTK